MKENLITGDILKCVYKVHSTIGPGLLESAYLNCLAYELKKSGFDILKEKALPLIYEEVKLEAGYRLDLLVNNQIVLEVKSIDGFSDIHTAQMLTYLKLSGCRLGYLLNFNVRSMKNGIKRLIMT